MKGTTKKRFQVEMWTQCSGWGNTWDEEDEWGQVRPQTFGTRAEAHAAIKEFLEEVKVAVEAGDMAEAYLRADFRVRCVRKEGT